MHANTDVKQTGVTVSPKGESLFWSYVTDQEKL